MKKIDIHVHVGMWENPIGGIEDNYPTAEMIKPAYDELDVEKGLLLPIVSFDCMWNNHTSEEAEYLANKFSDMFYWCCNLDPRMGNNSKTTDFSQYLLKCKERGAVGVGELTANLYVDDPLMENMFYHCGECDMPVIIHIAHQPYDCYGIRDDLGLPRIEKILKKYPKLKIVGHSTCFWSEISDNVTNENRFQYVKGKATGGRIVELMREYPNLYCDLSADSGYNAMTRDTDFTYRFFEEFSDRLMFGTDMCRPRHTHGASQLFKLGPWLDSSFEQGFVSEEIYKKICRENAIKVFKLNEEL